MISTRLISLKIGIEHRSILSLIDNYKDIFIKMGELKKEKEKTMKGRPFEVYYLNDNQLNFLISILGNSKNTIELKYSVAVNGLKAIHNLKEQVKKGHIYIIKKNDINLYKIGASINPIKRINAISTQSGEFIEKIFISEQCEIYNKIESKIHEEYKSCRNIGEWFKFDDKIVSIIIEEINKKVNRYNKYYKY
jgi:hypothetical protein